MIDFKLKEIIKLILYSFIDLFIFPSKQIKQNFILLIRLDAIGDYVLFRNFIEILETNEHYKSYHITLIGNSAWKGLSLELDKEYVDNFIWIDKRKFTYNFIYRFRKIKENGLYPKIATAS